MHLDDLRVFYELHCGTRRHHGLPPQPFAFFEAIHRNFFKLARGRVFLASCEHTPVAGALFLEDREVAYYKFAASDLTMQSLRPNNLVLWEAIQHYCHAGFQEIDLGRTAMHQDGLRRFKRGWGSVESTVDYHRIDPATNCQLREKGKETGWHNRVFRLLPIPLSRWFGGLLYRHAA
jgi:lipid II:glycine glycyltransferase (peptidoglycan interpeptide bridge formation enzyme)